MPEVIGEHGGTAVRSQVGHSDIKTLMAETGAIFGGEHSAHYHFRDFWGADSGMLAALHVLAALADSPVRCRTLMAEYQRYAASGELNFRVDDAPSCVDAVLKSFASPDCFGRPAGRCDRRPGRRRPGSTLRTSNTEPLLRGSTSRPHGRRCGCDRRHRG